MNNLLAAKIFLFIAAVLSALSAVYGGQIHQFLGFLASAVCFAAFLTVLLYEDPKKYDGGESKTYSKRYKDYRQKEISAASQTYAPSFAQEMKKEELRYANSEINGAFRQQRESSFKKEEIIADQIRLLNKFASAASHDLKNPLSSMKNIAYYFTHSVKLEGEVPNKMLKMLSGEVDRMNNMIVELLDSTRVKQLNKANADLSAIIESAAESQKDDRYCIDTTLQQLQVYADFERMRQVFSSIIRNAKEAMPEGGTITVKSYKSANEAFIEISDTGAGMDEDVLARCFDPMFSTKQAKALGMSLTVSKQIVTMHGGIIKAESIKGKGSKFVVNLPLSV